MKKFLVSILCLTMVLAILLPMTAMAVERGYYYVKTGNGKGLNVRTEPKKASGNIVCSIPYRSYVLVYEVSGSWAYIEAENPKGSGTVKGWVHTSYLVSKDPGKYVPSGDDPTTDDTLTSINNAAKALKILDEPYETVITTKKATNYVHLRWFPSTSAVYSGAYLRDTEIEVLAESKTWAQVRIVADGKIGFILKSCVAAVE